MESSTGGSDPNEEDKDKDKIVEGLKDSIIKREDLKITWDDVAGLEAAKEALKEAVILPTRFP
jgi:vacuolar protein-sorting-associated protein 4